jgi:transposase-like protein
VRDRALELYREVGPAEAARQLGLKSGTLRSWASRAGVSSPHVPYEWARDVTTWPATVAAQHFATLRRSKRSLAEVDRRLVALGLF